MVVHGSASAGATVSVNGMAVPLDQDGRFQAQVDLSPGGNVIEVVATDAAGDRRVAVVNVASAVPPPQPFVLLITEPADQSVVSDSTVRVSGRTGTEAVVTVNGVSVLVDEVGIFVADVTLQPGPNLIDVVATDADGRILSAVIAVIHRP